MFAADASLALAPLKQADDAVLVETTGQSLEQVVDRLEAIVRERMASTGERA